MHIDLKCFRRPQRENAQQAPGTAAATWLLTSMISKSSTSLALPKLLLWPCWAPVSPIVPCTPLS